MTDDSEALTRELRAKRIREHLRREERRLFQNRLLAIAALVLLVGLFWVAVGTDVGQRQRALGYITQPRNAILVFTGPKVERARGVLTDVQILDIGHARAFVLRSADGRERTFAVDPSVDMTPGHMREHMAFGDPVTVTYRRAGDQLVATQVTD